MNRIVVRRIVLLFLSLIAVPVCLSAQKRSDPLKPKWLTQKLPEAKTPLYSLVRTIGEGRNLSEARQSCMKDLTDFLEHNRGITVSSTLSGQETVFDNQDSHVQTKYSFEYKEDGRTFSIDSRKIDEYWTYKDGNYRCNVLYAVANKEGGDTNCDDISVSTRYGARGFIRSLVIPGWGQMYKGSYLKGGLILGGEAAFVAGIIAAENLRASYKKKMKEQPQHIKTYNTKADNCENIRNICIGGAAALYVYNLVDAIAANGAKRVIIKKKNGNLSVNPISSPFCNGVNMAYQFSLR